MEGTKQTTLAAESQKPQKGTPIGVFWDIENCPIPHGKSALAVAQRVRDKFFGGHREAEFVCVCDTSKECKDVIEDLNQAQVTVVHINATSKNAADDKLRQLLRRFAHAYQQPPVTVILMSGDVNFASELSDIRHRHNFHVILIHRRQTNEALLACAHQHMCYEELLSSVPCKSPIKQKDDPPKDLLITNLPLDRDYRQIRNRLHQLSDNCGGRVQNISKSSALIHFSSGRAAERAQKRMQGEDVFGYKISVNFAQSSRNNPDNKHTNTPSPLRNKAWRKAGLLGSPSKVQKPQAVKPRISSPKSYCIMANGQYRPWAQKQAYNTNANNYYYPQRERFPSCAPRYPYYEHSYTDLSYGGHAQWGHFNSIDENNPLHNPIEKYHREPSPREVIFLPQQIYQEEQIPRNIQHEIEIPLSMDCENPSLPTSYQPRTPSKSPQSWNSDGERTSPGFRRTPGSKRPSSRGSNSTRSSPGLSTDSSNFQPIRNYSPTSCDSDLCGSGNYQQGDGHGIELLVSNLDYNIRGREWKKILFTEFQQHVKVLGVYIHGQPDNTNIAFVKLPSVDDARYAISQFHRKKIGYKRIHVTLVNSDTPPTSEDIKMEVSALLKDAPEQTMPLFKFIEVYEKQYQKNLNTAELYKMRDIIDIRDDDGSGRVVVLVQELKKVMPALPQQFVQINEPEKEEKEQEPFICKLHCKDGSLEYKAAMENASMPNVMIQLRSLSTRVHSLLQSHDSGLPLASFIACHNAEFPPLKLAADGGVSLEYLISCVPGIEISTSLVKKIQWARNKTPDNDTESTSSGQALNQQLNQFCREVVELIRSQKSCKVLFSKFIPVYHQHFGHQCRVADYGYTKLLELFEAIPHVVQMVGSGSQRYVTLSHESQVKRFTGDLMRVLKSCASRQIDAIFIPNVYRNVLGREFDITNYGVCYLEDMLSEIPESSIVVSGVGAEMVLAIRKRDQTPSEIERTKQFAAEVIDLLKNQIGCRMPFRKFIPSYHHHFGRQCRVSDYGFTKLIELFEGISHIVQILAVDNEKLICLTEPELLKALGEQVTSLLQSYPDGTIPMPEFLSAYMKFHGHSLQLQDYGASSVSQLIEKIPDVAKVVGEGDKALVKLTPLQQFAVDMCTLLCKRQGRLPLSQIEAAHAQYFGVSLVPAAYGYPSVVAMIEAIPFVVSIHGKGVNRVILLNEEFRGRIDDSQQDTTLRNETPVKDAGIAHIDDEDELLLAQASLQHTVDLMYQPVPSTIPSPELQPYALVESDPDYVRFTVSPDQTLLMTDDEKRQQWTPLCRTPVSDMLQFAAQLLPADLAHQTPAIIEPVTVQEPGWIKGASNCGVNMATVHQGHGICAVPNQTVEIVSGMVNGASLKPPNFCFSQMQQTVDQIQFVDDIERGYVRQAGACYATMVQPVLTQPQEKPAKPEKANGIQELMQKAVTAKMHSPQDSLNNSVSSSSTASPSKQIGTPRKRRIAAKFTVPLDPVDG